MQNFHTGKSRFVVFMVFMKLPLPNYNLHHPKVQTTINVSNMTERNILKQLDQEEEYISDIFTAASIGEINYFSTLDNATVNVHNRNGWTPIMYASYYGHRGTVQLLLEKGSSVNVCNDVGLTPLMLAAMCGKEETCRELIDGGAILESVDHRNWNALFYATYFNHHSVAKYFLELNANTEVNENMNGFTAILLAAHEGLELVFQYLLQFNANVNARTLSGESAADLAKKKGHLKILGLLDNVRSSLSNRPLGRMLSVRDGPAVLARLMENKGKGSKNEETKDLKEFLEFIGLEKYLNIFVEQDVDLEVFLTLTDNDLKEIGIALLGPRRKMTSAIARWHSQAPIRNSAEEIYANKLEVEMQELAIGMQKSIYKIDKLEKTIEQERQLRTLVENCISEEKIFVNEILERCVEVNNSVERLKSGCVNLRKFSTVSDSVIALDEMQNEARTLDIIGEKLVEKALRRIRILERTTK